ncbi:MAG: diaminopimelate epimerase, partial [Caldimicrobium sp.]
MEIGSLFEKVKSDKFYKVSASGNDFIVFLDLDSKITLEEGAILARQLCRAKFSISADGFIIITRPSQTQAKFAWNFYNSDGSIAEMCGNGARAVARLLAELGMISEPFFLETLAGLIYAEVKGKRVKVSLGKPKDTKLSFTLRTEYDWYLAHYVNTGVPHVVLFWENVDSAPVE